MGGTASEVYLEEKEATERLGVKHQFDPVVAALN
jgi:hypothetical protein